LDEHGGAAEGGGDVDAEEGEAGPGGEHGRRVESVGSRVKRAKPAQWGTKRATPPGRTDTRITVRSAEVMMYVVSDVRPPFS
jgi:hypothetical protein